MHTFIHGYKPSLGPELTGKLIYVAIDKSEGGGIRVYKRAS
jgi:hypothetical protein